MIRSTLFALVTLTVLAGGALAGGDEPTSETPAVAQEAPVDAQPEEEAPAPKKLVVAAHVEDEAPAYNEAPSYDEEEPAYVEAEGCHSSYGY